MGVYDVLIKVTVIAGSREDAARVAGDWLPKPDQSEPPHDPVDEWELVMPKDQVALDPGWEPDGEALEWTRRLVSGNVPFKIVHEENPVTAVYKHRLVVTEQDGAVTDGEWFTYRSPAFIKIHERMFMYFGDYFNGSFLPRDLRRETEDITGKVLEVIIVNNED